MAFAPLTAAVLLALSAGQFDPGPAPCGLVPGVRETATVGGCVACHVDFDRGNRHPVDVAFPTFGFRNAHVLRARRDLPPDVVLRDGRLTCVTCHDGRSTRPFHLALPADAGQLCRACHDR